MSLRDGQGHRKYLTPSERQAFLRAAGTQPPDIETFCAMLAHTGCRISEGLALTLDRVDLADGLLIFESLKRRRKGVFRAVPVPPEFLRSLDATHSVGERQRAAGATGTRLWPWSRTTGWRRVIDVMDVAGINGIHATSKGLRHGFGIKAITSDVPLNLTQKWLGHARLTTTAIYADATGEEEKQIAQRMWL